VNTRSRAAFLSCVLLLGTVHATASCSSASSSGQDVDPTEHAPDSPPPGVERDDPARGGTGSDGGTSIAADGSVALSDGGSCAKQTADCDNDGTCETDLRTSVAHCGSCGTKCPSGATCAGSVCTAAIDGQAHVALGMRSLVADDQKAYWVGLANGEYTLRAVSHAASSFTVLATGVPHASFPYAEALGISDSHILLAVYAQTGATIHRAPKTGGAFSSLTYDSAGLLPGNIEASVVAGDGYVFWTGKGGVYRAPIAGGAPELWTKTSCARRLSIVSSVVYWSCYDGSVAHRSTSAAPVLDFAFPAYKADDWYAVNGSSLYYFDGSNVSSMPLAGPPGAVRASGVLSDATRLTTDGVTLYWSALTGGDRPVYAAPNQPGASAVQISSGGSQTFDIALGGSWLYFATNSSKVYRVKRL
jgi:hypothetical protein